MTSVRAFFRERWRDAMEFLRGRLERGPTGATGPPPGSSAFERFMQEFKAQNEARETPGKRS